MKKALRILGIVLWVIGIIWIVYITGAVFSRTEGYNSLAGLIGPFIFHAVCMALGGLCFIPAKQKAAEAKPAPVTQ